MVIPDPLTSASDSRAFSIDEALTILHRVGELWVCLPERMTAIQSGIVRMRRVKRANVAHYLRRGAPCPLAYILIWHRPRGRHLGT